jgi:ATP-dependent exoDNAse (exonuclease V) beta subunit
LHGVEAGRQRGIVTHRVLQHLDFAAAVNGGLGLQLRKLTERGIVTVEEVAAVDEAGLNWFLGTPLADAIRQAGEAYRREFQFVSMEPPHLFDPNVGDLPGDYVLVRGIVDGILPCPGGVEVIDFKTDAVSGDGVSRRAEGYQGQITLYARTVSRIWRRPVVGAWLVFLTPRVIVPSGEWPAAARSATAAGSTGR